MNKEQMTEAMKYQVVAQSIAMFQSALEKEFTGRGIVYATTIGSMVTEFASRLFFAYNLIPEREDVVPKTEAGPIQA